MDGIGIEHVPNTLSHGTTYNVGCDSRSLFTIHGRCWDWWSMNWKGNRRNGFGLKYLLPQRLIT